MRCSLLLPTGAAFSGEVSLVVAKGSEGELGILPGHAPLITTLQPGPVRLRLPDGTERRFRIGDLGGLLQVRPDPDGGEVLILAEEAEELG